MFHSICLSLSLYAHSHTVKCELVTTVRTITHTSCKNTHKCPHSLESSSPRYPNGNFTLRPHYFPTRHPQPADSQLSTLFWRYFAMKTTYFKQHILLILSKSNPPQDFDPEISIWAIYQPSPSGGTVCAHSPPFTASPLSPTFLPHLRSQSPGVGEQNSLAYCQNQSPVILFTAL